VLPKESPVERHAIVTERPLFEIADSREEHVEDAAMRLNGNELKLGPLDALPEMNGTSINAGEVTLARQQPHPRHSI
jgi:hypothetical protein